MEQSNSFESIRIHIWVSGRVQGVGFRSFVQHSGVSLGITGWVRNVSSDTIEIVAEGSRLILNKFFEGIKRGPPSSRVDDIRLVWEPAGAEFQSFLVKHSI
jgi:acylphosphatase